jgi:hypothetical protein
MFNFYYYQYPWSYYTSVDASNILNETSPLMCLVKPDGCTEKNYYRGSYKLDNGEKIYDQYGYVDSAASFGNSNNPFYGITHQDYMTCFLSTFLQYAPYI